MNIGDIVQVRPESAYKEQKAHAPTKIFRGDGRIPTRGRVIQITDRLVALKMLSDDGRELYVSSYLKSDVM